MTRIKLMLFTIFVLAVTTLSCGVQLTNAQPSSSAAIQGSDAKPGQSAADRARAIKAAALKRRQDAKKAIESVAAGSPHSSTAPPVNTNTGGAK